MHRNLQSTSGLQKEVNLLLNLQIFDSSIVPTLDMRCL